MATTRPTNGQETVGSRQSAVGSEEAVGSRQSAVGSEEHAAKRSRCPRGPSVRLRITHYALRVPRAAALAMAIVALFAASGCAPHTEELHVSADFYVAPNGNDAWSGRLAVPNGQGTDGPFRTVQRARDALRMVAHPRFSMLGKFVVLVRGGTYPLDGPIDFGPDDSGRPNFPILYAAYPGEQPVFTGARLITGWGPGKEKAWTARVPDLVLAPPPPGVAPVAGPRPSGTEKWMFNQLWVNGQRRTRARTPNSGYLETDGPLPDVGDPRTQRDNPAAKLGFRFKEGDLKQWENLDEVTLVVYHAWTASLHWIKSLDVAKREVRFTAPSGWPVGYWDRKQRYHVENCLDALDAPGEWYLDPKTRLLHYWPMPGEDMTKAVVQAPVLREMVRFLGDPVGGRLVHDITLRGLAFRHAAWWVDEKGVADGQAAAFLETAAIVATGMRKCALEYCEVGGVGAHGIWLGTGCKDNRIVHCHVHDLGAGGVRIGETTSARSQNQATERNTVDNCFIHGGGKVFRQGVGVWIGRSNYNTVKRNEIADFNYTGVSVGWTWGYGPSSANHNLVEYNHIHHIGNGVLSDLAGVYTLGVSPGTKVRYNRIHDIHCYKYGGWGIYSDEGSSNILIEGNLVYNTSTGGFHQHYGRENIVRNNIFAFSREAQIVRTREEPNISFTFTNNIVYCDHDAILGGSWRNNSYKLDENLYWVTTAAAPDFAGRSFPQWREAFQDRKSRIADPMFVNPVAFDFRLQRGSPARKIGFRRLPEKVGLYGEDYWVNAPRPMKWVSTLPGHRELGPVADDFEGTPVGAQAANARTLGEIGAASARVTEETAASGRRSLKFTDAPNLPDPSSPQLIYAPRQHEGMVRLTFDVRLEPGAEVWLEWRTQGGQYQSGPSLRIARNGALIAGGRSLMTVPARQWVRIEILCRLGKQAIGRYDLTVTVGNAAKRFDALPCGSPSFSRLQWLGFLSMSPGAAVWYLDNIRLDRLH